MMANMAGSEGDAAQSSTASSSAGKTGRYVKRKQQKGGGGQSTVDTPGDLPYTDEEANQHDADTQEVQLVPLDMYAVDEVKMANVFGSNPNDQKPVGSSMRLNPLVHDRSGTVVVPTDQAQKAKIDSSQDSGGHDDAARVGKSKKGTYKHPKKTTDDDGDEPTEDELQGPKINYSKNFRFKPRSNENGDAGGKNGVKKLTTFGVVMPSRVKENTIPKNQLVATGGPSQYALAQNGQTGQSKADIETANRRREMRRRWRYVIILILIILVFGLILTVVLYFATQAP